MRTWVRVAVSSGVSRRGGLDPVLLWFWRRPAAVAPIGPLAWEPPHAAGVALEKEKKKKWDLGTRSSDRSQPLIAMECGQSLAGCGHAVVKTLTD